MIAERLSTLTAYDHHADGEVPITPRRPYTVLYPSAHAPTSRSVAGAARASYLRDTIMCVCNSAEGAVLLARRVVDLFEGWRHHGQPVRTFVPSTRPIADPDMTDGYRWSVNVELTYYLPRSHHA